LGSVCSDIVHRTEGEEQKEEGPLEYPNDGCERRRDGHREVDGWPG